MHRIAGAAVLILPFLILSLSYAPSRAADHEALVAATLLGGSGLDGLYETPVVRDPAGNVFVAGRTVSGDFPTTAGAWRETPLGGADVFVAKFDADLTTLLAATYLGGSLEEAPWPGVALATDAAGRVYVATPTRSTDCPTTAGAYDAASNGNVDAWIARLDNDLGTIQAATYLGSPLAEGYLRLAVDASGDVFVGGQTRYGTFPTTEGAYDTTINGGYDVFVSRFDADLTTLVASTFVGGTNLEYLEALVLDGDGRVYVTGWTTSINYPVTPGGQTEPGDGDWDGFVSCLDVDLSTLRGSTYLGGTNWDFGYAMTVGVGGTVYVTGHTASLDFPLPPVGHDNTYNGHGGEDVGDDLFLVRFSPDLAAMLSGTFFGGSDWENGLGLGVDGQGRVFVGGGSSSNDLPTTPGALDESYNGGADHAGDGFLARYDANLTDLQVVTYLGGTSNDNLTHLLVEPDGHLLVSGTTSSTDFPTTDGAFDRTHNGGLHEYSGDVFVARVDPGLGVEPVSCLLQVFDVSQAGDRYLFQLRLDGLVDGGELRLTGRRDADLWEVPLTAAGGGVFTAEDRPFGDGSEPPVYRLHARSESGVWLLLGQRTAPGEGPPATAPSLVAAPNPFNPRIVIRFEVDRAGYVTLDAYDAAGRHVTTLVAADYPAGEHALTWEGRDRTGRRLASGAYLLELRTSSGSRREKITLLR